MHLPNGQFSLQLGNRRSRLRCLAIAALIVTYLALLHRWSVNDRVPGVSEEVKCTTIPGLEDVFVSIRTGATEIRKKLPVHLATRFKCVPSFAIFSDAEEDFFGHRVYDVLRNVSAETKTTNPDFELYWKLKEKGAQNLTPLDLYQANGDENNGHPSNRAWTLDKWKFLPIVETAWAMRPDAKWYFIMEPDTYVFWPNLIRFLSKYDHAEPHYIGSTMQIEDQPFVHGGGGIIISSAAMKKCVEYISSHRRELEEFTANNWAGDAILGKVMIDASITVRENWPLQQIHSVSGTDFARSEPKRMWCAPVLTYHHMTVDEIWALADFEQRWIDAKISNILLHKHIFEYFVLPQINLLKTKWDNFAGEHLKSNSISGMTREKCFIACRANPECKQYSVENGVCRMASHVHLGLPVTDGGRDIQSGWMRDRILRYFHRIIQPCEGNDDDAFSRY